MTKILVTSTMRAAIVVALGMAIASLCVAGDQCPILTDGDAARLVSYVVTKYSIPTGVKITLKSSSPVSNECYRKVIFGGQGPLGEFALTLFLSPDLRYLSKELLDTRLDPAQERYEAAQKVMGELSSGAVPELGNDNAPVTLVVFSDFECPYCKRAAELIRSEPLIAGGRQVRVIYRHFPLSQHPWAQKAAEAAACAEFQGSDRFWDLHDSIFRHQQEMTASGADVQLTKLAAGIHSVNILQFTDCMKNQLSLGVVLRDKEIATRLNVAATPTFYLNGELMQFGSVAELHKLLLDRLSVSKVNLK